MKSFRGYIKNTKAIRAVEFLTVQDVARMLSCSDDTVYRLVDSGEFEAIKFGRFIRIEKNSLVSRMQESTLIRRNRAQSARAV